MASSNLHRDEGSSFVLFVWFVFVFSPWIVGVRLRPNESLSLPSLGLEAYIKLSPVSLTLESGVTTKRRLRWVQPPRLGVRRVSSAAPRVLVLLRSHSERGSEVRGRRNCITTNYDKLYTMYLVYYVCATRSETYPM